MKRDCGYSRRKGKDTFNRTIIELKLPPLRPGRFFCMAFNRTIIELKLRMLMISQFPSGSFNRTIIELKRGRSDHGYLRRTAAFNRTIIELKPPNLRECLRPIGTF